LNLSLRIVLLAALLLYFVLILVFLRRKSLLLKYTLTWLIAGLVMLIIVIFPEGLTYLTSKIGIIEVTNGLFALALFFVLIILMTLTSIVSKLNEKNKKLIQRYALLEQDCRKLKEIHLWRMND
jgi:hypothetical protein